MTRSSIPHTLTRRMAIFELIVSAIISPSVNAQSGYSNCPIKIMMAFAVGRPNCVMARILAQRLQG